MTFGCFQIYFRSAVDVDNILAMGGGEDGSIEQGARVALPPSVTGLAFAPLVVAFASLVCSFGVTASRRSGCASRVPEDSWDTSAVFINSSLIKGV